jgi:hypothetical protein
VLVPNSNLDGQNGIALPKGTEHITGLLLADSICRHKPASQNQLLLSMKAKYKPVDKQMRLVPISVPTLKKEPYKPIPLPTIPKFPTHPLKIEEFTYTMKFTADRVAIILKNMEQDFLSKEETRLLFWALTENKDAIAFEDSEQGTFKKKYISSRLFMVPCSFVSNGLS